MIVVNYSVLGKKLKDCCDKATDNKEVFVETRKEDKNVVIMSLD